MAKSFASQLRRARLQNDMSQADVGKRLGVSQATIHNWEKDKSEPDEEQRRKLAQILGLSLNRRGRDDAEFSSEHALTIVRDWLRSSRKKKELSVGDLAEKSGLAPPTVYAIESGRITNPRQTTLKRLEEALGEKLPSDAKEEIAEEAGIEGLGQLVDFNPHSEEDLPSGPGVYVFYDVSERPIYVGQGGDIKKRIVDHKDKFWFRPPIVDTGSYVEIGDSTLRKKVETLLIKFLKSNAVINKQNVDR